MRRQGAPGDSTDPQVGSGYIRPALLAHLVGSVGFISWQFLRKHDVLVDTDEAKCFFHRNVLAAVHRLYNSTI